MTLRELLDLVLSRQRGIFITVALTVVVIAEVLTVTLPKEYETSATLFVGENRPVTEGAQAVQLDEVLATSYAELLETEDVEKQVADELPFAIDTGTLSSKVSVGVLTGTRLIEITAADGDPARARTIANTYADTFVSDRLKGIEDADSRQLRDLDSQITDLTAQIQELADSTGPGDQVAVARARNERSAVQAAYREALLNSGRAAGNVSVSSTAALPTEVAKPQPKLYLAIGVVLALALATVAAFLRNALDRRILGEEGARDVMPVPVLARIPAVGRSAKSREMARIAFQFLRTNLLDAVGLRRQIFVVTSAAPGDGKTTVTAELARAFARGGASVVVVECDLRKPRLAASLGVARTPGLSDALDGGVDPVELLQRTPDGIDVLPAGTRVEDPALTVRSEALYDITSALSACSDVVLIDTPPVLAGAEFSAITKAADFTIVVADETATRRDHLKATRDQLEHAGAITIGLVLNRVKDPGGYGYYYQTSGRDLADGRAEAEPDDRDQVDRTARGGVRPKSRERDPVRGVVEVPEEKGV